MTRKNSSSVSRSRRQRPRRGRCAFAPSAALFHEAATIERIIAQGGERRFSATAHFSRVSGRGTPRPCRGTDTVLDFKSARNCAGKKILGGAGLNRHRADSCTDSEAQAGCRQELVLDRSSVSKPLLVAQNLTAFYRQEQTELISGE